MKEYPSHNKEKIEQLLKKTKEVYNKLNNPKEFENMVFELCNNIEKEKINKLKKKLNWQEFPFKTLDEFITWINYPTNISNEAKELSKLLREKLLDELYKIQKIYKIYKINTYTLNLNIDRLSKSGGLI